MPKILTRKKSRCPAASRILAALALAFLIGPRAVGDELPEPTSSALASFHYTLVGIAQFDGVSYASFVDSHTGDHFLLSTQEKSERDVTLTAVHTQDDPSGSGAIVQKNGVSLLLGFEAAVLAPPDIASSQSQAPRIPRPGSTVAGDLKPPPGATLPLVFQEVDPKKMTLTDDQKATLSRLRQEFIKAVRGAAPVTTNGPTVAASEAASQPAVANQTVPAADDAFQKWEAAQEKSDEEFRMLYGTQAFLAYQESSSYPAAP